MGLKNKILIIGFAIILVSVIGVSGASDYQNNQQAIVDDAAGFGCCSIILQEDGIDSIMTFRRDSNVTADIKIENIDWHGIPAIKQYKTDGKYFSHVIITKDGWMIGFGGIDDGADSEKCENISSGMISDDFTISEEKLEEIQKIKQPYGRGHFIIKAPNGNYGFATVDKVKTGQLQPGHYISLPNDYSLSRAGELSLDGDDKIKEMVELAQSDKYGLDRRDIITYDYHSGDNAYADVYVSNEDGSLLGANYTGCVDDVYINDEQVKAEDIPIAPQYKSIGKLNFSGADSPLNIMAIVVCIVFVGAVSYGAFRFVRFIRRRK
ncbi:hypothetical protein [Methanobrevibacter sp.]|uniref:hypothetical protein n=1 Tax=Methanobrevibacter sp. TaxID=66852 RepID=UPI00388DE3D9